MFSKNKSEDADDNPPSLSFNEGNSNHNDDSVANLGMVTEDEEASLFLGVNSIDGAGGTSRLARRQQSGGGKHAPRLSVVSNKFDIGKKGHLTEAEQSARRLASQSGQISIEQLVQLKEQQKAMEKKVSSLVRRNFIMMMLLVISTVILVMTNVQGEQTLRLLVLFRMFNDLF